MVIVLVVQGKKAAEQKQADESMIAYHSNQWVQTSSDLQQQRQVGLELESQLAASKIEITNLNTTLGQAETNLQDAHAELKSTQDEVSKRDARIAELESQIQVLEKQAASLNDSITGLNAQIDAASNKLAAAEGDKAALGKELKRLIGEKTELEREFNDLNTLKAQVKKIRTDLVIAKRLERSRLGIETTEPKGAERTTMPVLPAPANGKYYFLNVEIGSDGATKIIPPATNGPMQAPVQKPSN